MPTLVDLLSFSIPPLAWHSEIGPVSEYCATFLWHRLSTVSRRSYEYFCQAHEQPAFPAQLHTLGEWVTGREIGSSMPWQDRIKPETIISLETIIQQA
jgi:hypothetical protein